MVLRRVDFFAIWSEKLIRHANATVSGLKIMEPDVEEIRLWAKKIYNLKIATYNTRTFNASLSEYQCSLL